MKLIILLCIILISSCSNNKPVRIVNDYYLSLFENNTNLCLSYSPYQNDNSVLIDLVTEQVVAESHDNNFIYIKQKPKGQHHIKYFIVPIYKLHTNFPEKGIKGPMRYRSFILELKKMDIKHKIHWKTTLGQ